MLRARWWFVCAFVIVASAVLLWAFSTSASYGQTPSIIDTAGHSLRSDPVYVASPVISQQQADELRQIIRGGVRPLFIAVLPGANLRPDHINANLLPAAVGRATGLSGTYAVVAGRVFRAASSRSANFSVAGSLATEAFQVQRPQGVFAVLKDFARRVEARPAKHASVWPWVLAVLALITLGLIAAYVWYHRRALRARKDGLAQDIADVQEDVNGLIVSDDTATSNAASRANVTLNQAAVALRGAQNHLDLDNVEKLVDRARSAVKDRAATELHDFRSRSRVDTSTQEGFMQTSEIKTKAAEALKTRTAATHAPRQPVAEAQRPRPAMTINVNTPYNGSGLGYYPMYGGWGYWGPGGNFVTDLIMWDMMTDAFEGGDFTEHDDFEGGGADVDTGTDGGSFADSGTGGGDFSDDQGAAVGGGGFSSSDSGEGGSDSGGGFDSGGGGSDSGGGFDSGGGGGGGDF